MPENGTRDLTRRLKGKGTSFGFLVINVCNNNNNNNNNTFNYKCAVARWQRL
jgi:hypothetical protein